MDNRNTGNGNQGATTRGEGHSPLDHLGPEMSRQLDELRGRLDETVDRAADFNRTRPGTSLLIAACAGYLIGRIVRS
jgi:hypothetical protein